MKTFATLAAVFFFTVAECQNIGINADGSTPNASAMLDIDVSAILGTKRGLLIPRITSLERDAIPSPALGLLVFNTDTKCFNYFDGVFWRPLCGGDIIIPLFTACGQNLIDLRDTMIYQTVLIGSQCWMAKNLDFDTVGSWFYNNNPMYEPYYGRLYNWSTAMHGAVASGSNPSGVRGVCPVGWHIPSIAEWQELITAIGGSNNGGDLKSTATGFALGEWNPPNLGATNSTGFSSVPSGSGPAFSLQGTDAYYWTSEDASISQGYYYFLDNTNPDLTQYQVVKTKGLSIRCVKD